jgi:hypothetical protein
MPTPTVKKAGGKGKIEYSPSIELDNLTLGAPQARFIIFFTPIDASKTPPLTRGTEVRVWVNGNRVPGSIQVMDESAVFFYDIPKGEMKFKVKIEVDDPRVPDYARTLGFDDTRFTEDGKLDIKLEHMDYGPGDDGYFASIIEKKSTLPVATGLLVRPRYEATFRLVRHVYDSADGRYVTEEQVLELGGVDPVTEIERPKTGILNLPSHVVAIEITTRRPGMQKIDWQAVDDADAKRETSVQGPNLKPIAANAADRRTPGLLLLFKGCGNAASWYKSDADRAKAHALTAFFAWIVATLFLYGLVPTGLENWALGGMIGLLLWIALVVVPFKWGIEAFNGLMQLVVPTNNRLANIMVAMTIAMGLLAYWSYREVEGVPLTVEYAQQQQSISERLEKERDANEKSYGMRVTNEELKIGRVAVETEAEPTVPDSTPIIEDRLREKYNQRRLITLILFLLTLPYSLVARREEGWGAIVSLWAWIWAKPEGPKEALKTAAEVGTSVVTGGGKTATDMATGIGAHMASTGLQNAAKRFMEAYRRAR